MFSGELSLGETRPICRRETRFSSASSVVAALSRGRMKNEGFLLGVKQFSVLIQTPDFTSGWRRKRRCVIFNKMIRNLKDTDDVDGKIN